MLMMVLGLGFVIFKNPYETSSVKHRFGLNYNEHYHIVINVALLLISILLLTDVSGELLKTVMGYSLLTLGGGAIAWAFIGSLYVLFFLVKSIWNSGNIEDPNLFNEMQWTLRDILRPLGFTLARQEHRGDKYATFTKGEFYLSLSWEDKACRLYVYDETGVAGDNKRHKPDFTTICRDYRKADIFKSEVISKLNEWLIKKKLK